MESKPGETFSSQQPSIVRNTRLDIIHISQFFPIIDILSISLSILSLFPIKKRKYFATGKYIFNTVDVFPDSLLLRTTGGNIETMERISIDKIDKVLIRKVYKEDIFGKDLITAFEFHHRYGQKPLLRYDIERREYFEDLLKQNNIQIVDSDFGVHDTKFPI